MRPKSQVLFLLNIHLQSLLLLVTRRMVKYARITSFPYSNWKPWKIDSLHGNYNFLFSSKMHKLSRSFIVFDVSLTSCNFQYPTPEGSPPCNWNPSSSNPRMHLPLKLVDSRPLKRGPWSTVTHLGPDKVFLRSKSKFSVINLVTNKPDKNLKLVNPIRNDIIFITSCASSYEEGKKVLLVFDLLRIN